MDFVLILGSTFYSYLPYAFANSTLDQGTETQT